MNLYSHNKALYSDAKLILRLRHEPGIVADKLFISTKIRNSMQYIFNLVVFYLVVSYLLNCSL